jgi:ribosomal protein L32
MAVPARKTSKTRKRNRRGHIKLTVPGLAPCPNCGAQVTHGLPKLWLLQRQASC